MPPRLILNADDFGLTLGINRAIAELHAAGAITSATLMATGAAFDDAVRIAHAQPTLGIGCHIVLTDGIPVLPPQTLPTLCPNHTTFRPKLLSFHRDVLLGRIDPGEIKRESLAQLHKLQSMGLHLTHVDTHKHTHIFPQVTRPLLKGCETAGILAIRNPFEPTSGLAFSGSHLMQNLKVRAASLLQPRFRALPQMANGTVHITDGTIGISATGNLNAETLAATLRALPADGTYELLCHPGYNDRDLAAVPTRLRAHREIELQALLEQLPKILSIPNAPTLISYAAL